MERCRWRDVDGERDLDGERFRWRERAERDIDGECVCKRENEKAVERECEEK